MGQAASSAETATKVKLSGRGEAAAKAGRGKIPSIAVTRDSYDPVTNPDGFILLGIAANRLMTKQLIEYFEGKFSLTPAQFDYPSEMTSSLRLNKALANFFNYKFAPHTPVLDSHISTGPGTTAVLTRLTQLVANAGEVLLVAAPSFSGFDHNIPIGTEVEPVPIPVPVEDMFGGKELAKIDEALKNSGKGTSPKVGGILLCNPHNPLGRCYPKEIVAGYAKLAEKYQVHLIVDEIYANSIFDNPKLGGEARPFYSVLSVDLAAEGVDPARVHVAYGISKDFGPNSFRVGVVVSRNEDIKTAFYYTFYFDIVSAPADVLWSTLLDDKQYLDYFLQENQKRLGEAYQYFTGWLDFHHLPYIESNAGSFIMASFRPVLEDVWRYGGAVGFTEDTSMADREKALAGALGKIKVNVGPGTGYHYPEPGWFRIVFALQRVATRTALIRIEKLLGWKSWEGLNELGHDQD